MITLLRARGVPQDRDMSQRLRCSCCFEGHVASEVPLAKTITNAASSGLLGDKGQVFCRLVADVDFGARLELEGKLNVRMAVPQTASRRASVAQRGNFDFEYIAQCLRSCGNLVALLPLPVHHLPGSLGQDGHRWVPLDIAQELKPAHRCSDRQGQPEPRRNFTRSVVVNHRHLQLYEVLGDGRDGEHLEGGLRDPHRQARGITEVMKTHQIFRI
mmetsp:Transcript_79767/g.200733  ORF Transcript_79767/g.200733 Transcript_79767/m.200733 type:complete len:215 (-) Transcript_79767:20-664(-)